MVGTSVTCIKVVFIGLKQSKTSVCSFLKARLQGCLMVHVATRYYSPFLPVLIPVPYQIIHDNTRTMFLCDRSVTYHAAWWRDDVLTRFITYKRKRQNMSVEKVAGQLLSHRIYLYFFRSETFCCFYFYMFILTYVVAVCSIIYFCNHQCNIVHCWIIHIVLNVDIAKITWNVTILCQDSNFFLFLFLQIPCIWYV